MLWLVGCLGLFSFSSMLVGCILVPTVVSEMTCIAKCILENLLKVWINAVKTLVKWTATDGLHHKYLLKLDEFYDKSEDAADYKLEVVN